jgi:RNA polymerase sigma-70 factor (ECF subfamily)
VGEASVRPAELAEEQLLVEAARRDPGRFGELYEAYFDRVYAYVMRRVRNRHAAEDVTSEVFQQALASVGRFEWRGVPFAAWLYRIARNAVIDHVKRVAREGPLEAVESVADPETPQLEHHARLHRLVEALPQDQRRVVSMRFVEQKTIREIARELGRSEGAVKQLQFRALSTLRERMVEANG